MRTFAHVENPHDRPSPPALPNAPEPADRPERLREVSRPQRGDAPPPVPVVEPYQRRLDQPSGRTGDTPREAIRAFTPEHAGLEPITGQEAKQYVREHVTDRP